MRRRWPWILVLGVSVLLAAGSMVMGQLEPIPNEDGRSAVPLLRMPPDEAVARRGPIAKAPLSVADVTFRVGFRWLGTAPSAEELEKATRELAAQTLADFTVQRRPAASWTRSFRREPLVSAPGLEFVHVKLPLDYDLSHYETATSEYENLEASGQRPTGSEVISFTRDLFLVDFHVRGDQVRGRLRDVDAFIIAFAERTNGRVKSDEVKRQASADEIRRRRLDRWVDGVPFGPSYAGLVELSAPRGMRVLATEETKVLGLPDFWVEVPEGVLTARARHLLIAAVLQRFVENPAPDAEGVVELDVRALKHPDLAQWATAALPPSGTGKLRLLARDAGSRERRVVLLRPEGDAAKALCEFAACELNATYGQ